MTIFAIPTGASSDLVRNQPRPGGLGPNQIAWCRENIPLFAIMQDRALRNREQMEAANGGRPRL